MPNTAAAIQPPIPTHPKPLLQSKTTPFLLIFYVLSMALNGKLCLITGASRGIGEAIAKTFAKEGASLLLLARSEAPMGKIAEECKKLGSPACDVFPVDLSDGPAVDEAAKKILEKHSSIDVLVNNAGGFPEGGSTPTEGIIENWEKMMSLNLMTPMRLTLHFSPGMVEKKNGAIINIGSVAGVEPMTVGCAYAASKWGLRGWSHSCYNNLRNHGIKVCCINPGMVRTIMATVVPNVVEENMIKPEDIAEACVLVVKTSYNCAPQDIVLRNTLFALKT